MNSDADNTWDRAIRKLRRKQGFSPLTPEEAEAAYEAAPAVPLSAARISEIVKFATGAQEPVTAEPLTLSDWSRRFPLKAMKKFQFTLAVMRERVPNRWLSTIGSSGSECDLSVSTKV